MPEHLRSLVVILVLATAVFAFAKAPACALAFTSGDFERRRNLWFGITLAAFLAHNFWLFIFLTGMLLHVVSSKDKNKVGLVFFVLLAVPAFRAEIPGVGGIRYLFDLDYLRLISLVVLLPAFMQEAFKHSWKHFSGEISDKFIFSYLIWGLSLAFLSGSFTGGLRTTFLVFIDIVLPYAIASRLTKDIVSFRSTLASYVISAAILAAIGVFEFSRNWLLYSTLDEALGLNWDYGSYLKREGILRAMGTAGQPIPFGYAMAIGFSLMLGLRRIFPQKAVWAAGLVLLAAGMFSSFSRGPWAGALMGFLVFTFTGPQKGRNFVRLALFGVVLAPVLIVSPIGEKLLHALTTESGNYTYRQRLFEISTDLILRHPFVGASDYIYSAAIQELKQGQGIIDIVNTYLVIGLSSGLVGLFLFVAFFLSAWIGVWRRMNLVSDKDSEMRDIGRGLLAALTCIVVTIGTVSSITIIPVIYFLVAGLAVAYARLGRAEPEEPVPQQHLNSQSSISRYRVAAFRR